MTYQQLGNKEPSLRVFHYSVKKLDQN